MNEHGRLPKAERDQLSAELHERLMVWFDKAYQDDNLFLTLARRPAASQRDGQGFWQAQRRAGQQHTGCPAAADGGL